MQHKFTKIGQQKIKKMFPGLMSFSWENWMVQSAFSINNMNDGMDVLALIHWFRMAMVV